MSRLFSGHIPIKNLIIEKCRASTRVSVSLHLKSASWLPDETRTKLADLHGPNLSKEGMLTVRSDKTRHRTLNIADCLDKLRAYISEAEQPPPASQETLETKRRRMELAAAELLIDRK